jgi:threonine dehydrogenase-like Zn-dependent dehydrogenase
LKEIDLKGVRIHSYNNFRTAADIINSGKLTPKLKKLVSKHYSVNDAQKAFEEIKKDKSIVKALIKFS